MNTLPWSGEPGDAIEDPIYNTRFNESSNGGVYPWKSNFDGTRYLLIHDFIGYINDLLLNME